MANKPHSRAFLRFDLTSSSALTPAPAAIVPSTRVTVLLLATLSGSFLTCIARSAKLTWDAMNLDGEESERSRFCFCVIRITDVCALSVSLSCQHYFYTCTTWLPTPPHTNDMMARDTPRILLIGPAELRAGRHHYPSRSSFPPLRRPAERRAGRRPYPTLSSSSLRHPAERRAGRRHSLRSKPSPAVHMATGCLMASRFFPSVYDYTTREVLFCADVSFFTHFSFHRKQTFPQGNERFTVPRSTGTNPNVFACATVCQRKSPWCAILTESLTTTGKVDAWGEKNAKQENADTAIFFTFRLWNVPKEWRIEYNRSNTSSVRFVPKRIVQHAIVFLKTKDE